MFVTFVADFDHCLSSFVCLDVARKIAEGAASASSPAPRGRRARSSEGGSLDRELFV